MPEIPGRDEQILQAIINGTEYTQTPQSRIEYLLLQLKAIIEDGSGVSDYTELENKPSINNVILVGNKSLSDLGIVNPMMIKGRVNSVSDLPQVAETGWVYFVGRSDDADLREYVYTVNGEWEFLGYLSIVVDSALSTTSENPVQNKVITNAMVGEKTTGKQYVIDGQTVTAGNGAEIFNDYVNNKATGQYSHAEGWLNTASGDYSHAEGCETRASGPCSHAEGWLNTASGDYSHAEGRETIASGDCSHAEGYYRTTASGDYSHAEGYYTRASGPCSHAEGLATIAASTNQHVQGKYNVEDENDTYAFIIGNGNFNARHNAFAIDWNGNIYVDNSSTGVNLNTVASDVQANAKVIEQNKTDISLISDRVTELERGQDEFSPIVDVITIDGGHRVTITDKQGTESFDVMDGETPKKGVDYWTEADVEAINTASEAYIVSELADRAQIEPLFAESVEWLNETGDMTKLYVLPDGYIYAYMTSEVLVPAPNEFDVDVAKLNTRLSSSGSESTGNGIVATDYISVSLTSPYYVTFSGIDSIFKHGTYAYAIHLTYFDSGKNRIGAKVLQADTISLPHTFNIFDSSYSNAAFVRFAICINSSSAITKTDCEGLSIVCESKSETITTTGWFSTKHAFVPADYEDRIIDLENDVNNLKIGFDNEISVPDFWENAVEDCISKIKSLQNGRNTVTFAFFSDNHQRNGYSGLLIAKVMKECHIPYAFYGGDSIDSGYIASEAVMVEQDKKFDTAMSYIPNGRFCRAVGNHDGYWAVSSTEKYYYTREQIYDLFLREEAVSQLKHFGGDGTYYYVDDIASKMRFIVLNTNGGIDSTQLEWLQNTAMQFAEDSWGIVFISHQPISNHYHANISNAETVRAAVSNYINGTSANKAEVVGWFSGHIHRDRIYTGVAVNTTDDAEGETMPFKQITITSDHTGIAYDDATKHTIGDDDKSHAIDFVTINKDTRKVNITRLGIGEDREYAY